MLKRHRVGLVSAPVRTGHNPALQRDASDLPPADVFKSIGKLGSRFPAVLDIAANTLTIYSQKHAPAPFVVELAPEGFPEDGTLLQCVPRPDTRATLPALTANPDLLARFGTDRLTLTFTGAGRGILVQTPDPDFFGVAMPCKDAAPVYANGNTEPDWLRDAYGNLTREVAA